MREAADHRREDRGVLGDHELVGVVGAEDADPGALGGAVVRHPRPVGGHLASREARLVGLARGLAAPRGLMELLKLATRYAGAALPTSLPSVFLVGICRARWYRRSR